MSFKFGIVISTNFPCWVIPICPVGEITDGSVSGIVTLVIDSPNNSKVEIP